MSNLIQEAKLMQLKAGLITEDEYREATNTPPAPPMPDKKAPSQSTGKEEVVVKDLPTLKLYLKQIGTNQIPVSLDPKEAVELYNYISQYIQKGAKNSISGLGKMTNTYFTRTTKNLKA